jgi:hypothetical protein
MNFDFLRDQVWTFFGAAVALVAVVVTIWFHIAGRQRKRLVVEPTSAFSLVDRGKHGIDGLALVFNGTPIDDAVAVVVRISNAGNTPILAADFEHPLKITFVRGANILNADILETQPPGIPAEVTAAGSVASFPGTLLNPGDEVSCRFLLEGDSWEFSSSGRIAGVASIERAIRPSIIPAVIALVGITLMLVGGIRSPHLFGITEPRPGDLFSFALIIFGMVLFTLATAGRLIATLEKRYKFRVRKKSQ